MLAVTSSERIGHEIVCYEVCVGVVGGFIDCHLT